MKNWRVSLVLVLAFIQPGPALADDFADGVTLYNIKHYKNAELSFKKALSANPANAATHYYLGMTYMNCGKSALAKQEFQTCLNLRPDATTTQYCQSLLARLSGAVPARPAVGPQGAAAVSRSSGSSSSAVSASSGSSSAAAASPAGGNAHDADVALRKQRIMDKANKEIAELREELEQRMSNGANVGESTHYYVKEDGTTIYDFSPEKRAEIRKEYEDKIEKIRELAEYQCKFVK